MQENVRLVIWDLDETFWEGTVTEGGIKNYIQSNHEAVIELAKRGIMSSICSKNDFTVVADILTKAGIFDYFIFPSINWESKGSRVRQIIEDSQLRPETVMFIDDNANNRAEVADSVKGIQIESEIFVSSILGDRRFQGKADAELSRLKQYKLLESKKVDQQQSAGSNEDFLKSCDIKVFLDYDVEANIDRAIELINRTNQLNYTKRRLPEDIDLARVELRKQLDAFDRRAALVRVVDKYGDYGYVGFFLTAAGRKQIAQGAANHQLLHYCFSCRTLGMLVEKWLYDKLGRPELNVVGDVVTDLEQEILINWITEVNENKSFVGKFERIATKMVSIGGCESHVIGSYLSAYADQLETIGNYAAGGLFLRVDSSAMLLDAPERAGPNFEEEAKFLEIPYELETRDIFSSDYEGACYLLRLGLDIQNNHLYQHKKWGWKIFVEPRMIRKKFDFMASESDVMAHLDEYPDFYDAEKRAHVLKVAGHIRENYKLARAELTPEIRIREIIERVPKGARLILASPHHEVRTNYPESGVKPLASVLEFVKTITDISRDYDYVGVLPFSVAVSSEKDLREADHLERHVYQKIAVKAVSIFKELKPRSSYPLSRRRCLLNFFPVENRGVPLDEAKDVVNAVFEVLLRREPESDHFIQRLNIGAISIPEFIRAVGRSKEFMMKWQAN